MTTEVYRNMAWRAKTGAASLMLTEQDNGIQLDTSQLSLLDSARFERDDDYAELSSNSIVVLDECKYKEFPERIHFLSVVVKMDLFSLFDLFLSSFSSPLYG
jgi:hypothetical protein